MSKRHGVGEQDMKILLVYRHLATFVKIDLNILRSKHEVHELHIRGHHFLDLATDMVRTIRCVFWADVVFSWFGGYHALLPFIIGRLLGRKCIVIASGYDVAALPEINYGNMRSGIRKYIGFCVFHLAHMVLPVSQFTEQEVVRNVKVSPGKLRMIYHGLDTSHVSDKHDLLMQRRGVITVSSVKHDKLFVKGLFTFVKVASQIPDTPFLLIGSWVDDSINTLRAIAPPNVEFVGPLFEGELLACMNSSKVYAQLSASESFGMAVAEAMLMGCVPVVTNCGALPEVVGDNGFYVPYDDLPATTEAILKALALGPETSARCRQQIIDKFPLEKRREQLLQVIRDLWSRDQTAGIS